MTGINTDVEINAQLQNWENFFQYHAIGDWHGNWTRYSPEGKTLEGFKCVRCFQVSEDGSEVTHQNHYTYADGKTETKIFGPYQKPVTTALFLENSFFWGSARVEAASIFGFEIGFKYENSGASAAVMYDNSGNLERITIISEELGAFPSKPLHPPTSKLKSDLKGILKSMTDDLITSAPEVSLWKSLEDLGDDYQSLHFSDGVSISCPRQVFSGKAMLLAMDWWANPALLQRGIRYFDQSGSTNFTLENFTLNS